MFSCDLKEYMCISTAAEATLMLHLLSRLLMMKFSPARTLGLCLTESI